MATEQNNVILKFEFAGEQTVQNITKINGLVGARYLVPIIDNLGLEANPRSSKTGDVTEAIQGTIANNPRLFPFMSKGILLAASQYERLERGRIKFSVVDPRVEGILDGGHNTLAIGLYILGKALAHNNEKMPKGSKTWDQFKALWNDKRELVENYLKSLQTLTNTDDMQFLVPVELLVPRDSGDESCVFSFRNDLYDICEARNHNHELDLSTKENQRGYYEYIKDALEAHNHQIAERVRWKTNTTGDVKVVDIIALSWIALNLVQPVRDEKTGKPIEPVAANRIFSSKGTCLAQFDRFMGSPDVTTEGDETYKRELMNDEVKSAFKVAAALPALYDYIYEHFPHFYNVSGGSYGKIIAVKNVNEGRREKHTPFSGKEIDTLSPEGFIMPLVYGLQSLMANVVDGDGKRSIVWRQDPMTYLENNLEKIVREYKEVIIGFEYDPQEVGKKMLSYNTALRLFKD